MPELLNLQIRPATQADLPAIVRMLAQDELGSRRERFEEPLSQVYYTAFEAIEADPNQNLIVADLNREVVGTLELMYLPSISYQGGIRAQVESVRVLERLQGQGIGARMMEWAFEQARQLDAI